MKYFYALAILLAALPLLSNAQSNYKPGYIIGLKGDTTYGYINYREWKLSPREADFKHDLNSATINKITVKNSAAFAITGYALFERHALSISMDHADLAHLSIGIDTSHVIDTVFINVINKRGPVKLYQYADNVKTRLFVSDNGGLPAELVYRNYYDNEQKVVTQKRYVVQLVQLANTHGINSESFNEQIDNTDYSEAGILKIVNKINGSKHDAVADNAHSKKNIQLYAGIGLNSSIIKYNMADSYDTGPIDSKGSALTKANFKRTYFPIVTFGTNIYFDQRRRYFVKANLALTGAKSNISVSTADLNDVNQYTYTTTATFNQYNAAISAMFVYNVLNTENFKFYLSTGLTGNISTYSNHTFLQYFKYYDHPISTDNFPELRSIWGQLPLSAGIAINHKLEFFATYFLPAQVVTVYPTFEAKESSMHIGINYYFGKN